MAGRLRSALAVGTAWGIGLLGAAASAQVDVESIAFERSVALVDGGAESESARFEVVVRGAGITSATLTRPDDSDEPLGEDPAGTWTAGFDLADEAALDAGWPGAGDTYTLDLNDGERVIEIVYDAPDLPGGFAIDSPVHDSQNNSPSTTPFTFSGCSASECTNDDDHVLVKIERGANTVASGVVDDPDAGAWTPADPDEVPIVLPEDANLSFTAQLTAWRTLFGVADLDDDYVFFNVFRLSDTVDFSTGFKGLDEAPVGPFTLAEADPAAGILVTAGPVTTSIGGVDLDFDYDVAPTGKILGEGNADADDNGSFETPVVVSGKLSGVDAMATEKLKIKIKNDTFAERTKARYRRVDAVDLVGEGIARQETLKGKILGTRIVEEVPSADTIAGADTSWQVDFTLSTEDGRAMIVSDASITIGGGAPIPLEGGGKYDSVAQATKLTLKSTGDLKGIKVKVLGLTVDDMDAISGGTVRVKAFGQKVTSDLAP